MKKKTVLRVRAPIAEEISKSIYEREPDPKKGGGGVFAYVKSGDWLFLMMNELPSAIQDVPIAIKLGLRQGLPYRLPAIVASEATTSVEPNIASVAEKFGELANEWHDEVDFLSSPSVITGNDTYLQIISMGREVIPLILEDLKERGGLWYRALRILSGEDPVHIDERGNIEEMKRAWLEWGRERGYIE